MCATSLHFVPPFASMDPMAEITVSAPTRLGPKGRIVVPAEIRRAAGLAEGSPVVIWCDGEGRVVLETADSARGRAWAGAPEVSGSDVDADTRAMRDEDNRVSDRNARRRSRASATASDEAARNLLETLNL